MPYSKLIKTDKGFKVKKLDTGEVIHLHTDSEKEAHKTLAIREWFANK